MKSKDIIRVYWVQTIEVGTRITCHLTVSAFKVVTIPILNHGTEMNQQIRTELNRKRNFQFCSKLEPYGTKSLQISRHTEIVSHNDDLKHLLLNNTFCMLSYAKKGSHGIPCWTHKLGWRLQLRLLSVRFGSVWVMKSFPLTLTQTELMGQWVTSSGQLEFGDPELIKIG